MIYLELLFWFLLALLFYLYFGYPLTLFLLSFFKKDVCSWNQGEYYPTVSLIIPAFNEEKVLEKKILNVLKLDYPPEKLEVWIMSDGSTDKTDSIAEKYVSDRIHLYRQEPRQGKTAGLNKVVSRCKHDIIVFTDANSMYKVNSLKYLTAPFQDSQIGLVCGKLTYLNIKDGTECREGLYWKYEDMLKRLESKLGQVLVVNGSIYAIRKELFEPFPSFIADDFGNPMIIGSSGCKLVYEPRAQVFEHAAASTGEEFRTKKRIITRGLFGTLVLRHRILQSPFLRIFEFLFHKLLRWHVPFVLFLLLVMNLPLFLHRFPLYCLTFLFQLVFYSLAFLGFLFRNKEENILKKAIMVPYYFCEVNAAAFMAFGRFFRNKPQATWESARSTRK